MSGTVLELADLAADEKMLLKGFKILGVIPFYLKFITGYTHVRLCKIKKKIEILLDGRELKVSDYYDPELMEKLTPLVYEYCYVGLLNDRPFNFLIKKSLKRKVESCGHRHIHSMYLTITKLDDPAFFLDYYPHIGIPDNTLLKAVKQ